MRSTLVLIFFVCLTASPVVSDAGACGDKRLCGDMATCAEAHHYLPACNVQSLDRDNDGVPCETICGKSLSTMQSRLLGPYMSSVQVETQCSGLWIASNSAAATCQQMTSCGEAKFHMTSCGVGWLDGNGDGVACNGGWDAYREKAFARQKELGIVPKEAALSRHDPDVQNWTTLSADERRLYAMMEVFCRIPHPHRHYIGELTAFLKTIGEYDNTLIMLISDNGASPEGGSTGSVNENKFQQCAGRPEAESRGDRR